MKKFSLIAALASLIFFGCAEKDLDPNDPKKSFANARSFYDDEYYDLAVTKLGEFRARFPYSKYAIEAELLIANAHFKSGNYAESSVAYAQFLKLNPKHPQVDYAQFQVGESYWQEAPDDIDREQEITKRAIASWEKLIKENPESKFAAEAEKKIAKGVRRIAESIDFIGEFYCKLEEWAACAYRYMELGESYPQFKDLTKKSARMAAMALENLAVIKDEDPESDKNLFFKTMSAAEIREKAANLKKLAAAAGKA